MSKMWSAKEITDFPDFEIDNEVSNEPKLLYHHDQPMTWVIVESEKLKQALNRQEASQMLFEALELKTSPRVRDIAKAEKLLTDLASTEQSDPILRTHALLALCEIHLYELKASGDSSIIVDIEEIIDQITQISKKFKLDELWIETRLINAKI